MKYLSLPAAPVAEADHDLRSHRGLRLRWGLPRWGFRPVRLPERLISLLAAHARRKSLFNQMLSGRYADNAAWPSAEPPNKPLRSEGESDAEDA